LKIVAFAALFLTSLAIAGETEILIRRDSRGFPVLDSKRHVAGENEKFIRRDVPFGKAVNLQEFGGPNIAVAVTAAEMSYISANIADYTQLVPVASTTFQGGIVDTQIAMVPTSDGRRVEKKDGVLFPADRSEMYLLYHDRGSGIRVYFLDSISPQNHHSLVVAVPLPPLPPPPQPSPPTTSASPEPTRQAGDGVLSSELLAWYLKLQSARQSLNTANSAAVEQFNKQAAEYHDAVKKARAAKEPQ
jgi:hypothetical protein